MTDRRFAVLEGRGVLAVHGEDTRTFLQGLVSNDVNRVTPTQAIYAALLTPQGKFLHDFFIAEGADGAVLLDTEVGRLTDLTRRLTLYRLRSKVTLENRSQDMAVAVLFGADAAEAVGLASSDVGTAVPLAGGIAFVDPRLADAGVRALLPRDRVDDILRGAGFVAVQEADYDAERIAFGLPDGSRDMEVERAILLENGFDELHGVDWEKGCYVGQELTARTKYRALIKKRLMPVVIDGPTPAPGTPVRIGDKDVGEVRSSANRHGLALIRLEALDADGAATMTAGDARITPRKPAWASF